MEFYLSVLKPQGELVVNMAVIEDTGGGLNETCEKADTSQQKQQEESVIISDVVLSFMHSWFQGSNQQEIVKLPLCSFSSQQLSGATKQILDKFPEVC